MNLRQRFAEALMPNYGTVELALTHGEGAVVYDVDGKDYLDFIGGIATSVLGHAHPALVAAVGDQVAKIAHTSNLFINQPAVELAERLLGLFDVPGKVFFTNSGAEANECALKLAMIHGRPDGRTRFVAAADGFHGRTLGALALTGKDVIREPFAPFGVDVTFVPYGDVAALAETVDHTVAAVFLEPLQGEAGVKPPPAGYLSTARTVCDNAGALLVLDEIQSGMGRTGAWFAHQQENVTPTSSQWPRASPVACPWAPVSGSARSVISSAPALTDRPSGATRCRRRRRWRCSTRSRTTDSWTTRSPWADGWSTAWRRWGIRLCRACGVEGCGWASS